MCIRDRFRPYIIIAPPFLAIFDILTFTVWPVEGAMKAVLCGVSYILAGMAYTAVGVATVSYTHLDVSGTLHTGNRQKIRKRNVESIPGKRSGERL